MASLVHVEPGDVLVFSNVGRLPDAIAEPLRLFLDTMQESLDVRVILFERDADVSVVRKAQLGVDLSQMGDHAEYDGCPQCVAIAEAKRTEPDGGADAVAGA